MDILARYEKGPFNLSAVAGMGLYLIIILVQAGISTGALVEQNIYWVNYMQQYLDDEGFDATAKSYASTQILMGSAGFAFVAAFLVLVDTIFYRCNEKRQAALEDQRIADFVRAAKEAPSNTEYDIDKTKTVDTAVDATDSGNEDQPKTYDSGMPEWLTGV